MGLTKKRIATDLDRVAAREPAIAAALDTAGYPPPRRRARGYPTLLRIIVGQQVSVAAASSVWSKLEALLGRGCAAAALLDRDFDELRACGLSRQKQGYARSLASLVLSGELPLEGLPKDDEEAIGLLTQVKGIGRWSAEIYLLFAEGRPDIWPAGDLAVRAGVGKILGLEDRPTEGATRSLAEPWSPHRSAVAIFTWHYYNTTGQPL